jgi:PBP1b-binding outer membrane lipoprotein LpoB
MIARGGMVLLATVAAVMMAGCTGETKRLAPDELSDIEIGTGLSSQDFRSVSQRMARSLITLEQIQNATTPPKMAFVSVANNSNEIIDGDAFLNKMRTELIKHSRGRIAFLDRALIAQIEKENRNKGLGKRTTSGEKPLLGADFFLTGTIESIDRVSGAGHTTYLRLSFRLTDAGSSAIVWEDDYEFKKHATAGLMYR